MNTTVHPAEAINPQAAVSELDTYAQLAGIWIKAAAQYVERAAKSMYAKESSDWHDLAVSASLRAARYGRLAKAAVPAWHAQALEFLNTDQYIAAIKYCREQTGLGLKEAKDAIDVLRAPILARAAQAEAA